MRAYLVQTSIYRERDLCCWECNTNHDHWNWVYEYEYFIAWPELGEDCRFQLSPLIIPAFLSYLYKLQNFARAQTIMSFKANKSDQFP